MLTRLVVDLYGWILEVAMWILLLGSAVAGYYFAVPMLEDMGWELRGEQGWRVIGAALLLLAAFLASAVIAGPFLVLVDIRRSLRTLEAKYGGTGLGLLRTERREPGSIM